VKSNATSPGSLSGIRILDMATVLAAPLGATLCADHGAEVVKLELPDGSDALRALQPVKDGVPLWWKIANRGKRGITLDVRQPRGREVFLEMLPSFDVLVENFRTGTMDRWGLDIETLHRVNPRLIVVRLSGANAVDLAALSTRLKSQVKGASLDDHRSWTARLQTMANATVVVGIGVLVLVFVATILSVVFATRGAMAGNRDVVSVLHFVGAEDGYIAREFQRHFLLLGLKGGLAGAIAAALVFVLLGFLIAPSMTTPETDQVSALFGRFAVGPIGYLGVVGIALLIAVMTAITSRLTVYRYLADAE